MLTGAAGVPDEQPRGIESPREMPCLDAMMKPAHGRSRDSDLRQDEPSRRQRRYLPIPLLKRWQYRHHATRLNGDARRHADWPAQEAGAGRCHRSLSAALTPRLITPSRRF